MVDSATQEMPDRERGDEYVEIRIDLRSDSIPPLLSILSDPASRSMLSSADAPSTAKELRTRCELPRSTAYRKLVEMEETPLVEATTRPRFRGKHPEQFERTVDFVTVQLGCTRTPSSAVDPDREKRSPAEMDIDEPADSQ